MLYYVCNVDETYAGVSSGSSGLGGLGAVPVSLGPVDLVGWVQSRYQNSIEVFTVFFFTDVHR